MDHLGHSRQRVEPRIDIARSTTGRFDADRRMAQVACNLCGAAHEIFRDWLVNVTGRVSSPDVCDRNQGYHAPPHHLLSRSSPSIHMSTAQANFRSWSECFDECPQTLSHGQPYCSASMFFRQKPVGNLLPCLR
mgnify:CR=1 FL=1